MATAITTATITPAIAPVGNYRRVLPVSLERLYENAIDWAHLPYLHRTSFSKIECVEDGAWGFRARVWGQPYDEHRMFLIELILDRENRRWITSTLEGFGRGSKIVTDATPMGDRETHIDANFFVPRVAPDRISEIANYYRNLYTRLYDEDVSMMSVRQAQLDAIKSANVSAPRQSRRVLGSLDEVRSRLPIVIDDRGRQFRIVEIDGKLIAHATVCPHALGPLDHATVADGIIECPWHGYRFDIVTRRCVSGQSCSLAPAPEIIVDANSVIVEWKTTTEI